VLKPEIKRLLLLPHKLTLGSYSSILSNSLSLRRAY
jgi:hypothetical protein